MAAYRCLSPLMESDFPPALRAEIRSIKETLTSSPATYPFIPGDDMNMPQATRLGATVMHMRIKRLIAVATRIVDLADELELIALNGDVAPRAKNPKPSRHPTVGGFR